MIENQCIKFSLVALYSNKRKVGDKMENVRRTYSITTEYIGGDVSCIVFVKPAMQPALATDGLTLQTVAFLVILQR